MQFTLMLRNEGSRLLDWQNNFQDKITMKIMIDKVNEVKHNIVYAEVQ